MYLDSNSNGNVRPVEEVVLKKPSQCFCVIHTYMLMHILISHDPRKVEKADLYKPLVTHTRFFVLNDVELAERKQT